MAAPAENPQINGFFEKKTATWQYIVADTKEKECVIIDSVLDFDPASSTISTQSADELLEFVAANGLKVVRILETHAHADHLTASQYLQKQLAKTQGAAAKPPVCIGKRITSVQQRFGAVYEVPAGEYDGVFDCLLEDNEQFPVGSLTATVLHLPGHTPDHVGYLLGGNVFTGDSIFNYDVGSARCDFPGGSADDLYASMQTLLALPAETRLYTGHDYPPGGDNGRNEPVPYHTVAQQRELNKHVGKGISKDQFLTFRRERDAQLGEPRLLHQSLQHNIRAGRLPDAHPASGRRFLRVPMRVPPSVSDA